MLPDPRNHGSGVRCVFSSEALSLSLYMHSVQESRGQLIQTDHQKSPKGGRVIPPRLALRVQPLGLRPRHKVSPNIHVYQWQKAVTRVTRYMASP